MESLLKQVIIRIDFSPISNFIDFIMKLRNNPIMMDYFEQSREIKTNNVNIVLNQNKDVLQDAKLSVNDTTSVYRFYESKKFDQKTEFDISDSFMCLTIACDSKYTNCCPYLQFVAERMVEVKSFDIYARIKRIGLRKIDSEDFSDIDVGNKIFKNVNACCMEKKMGDDQTRVRLKQNYSEQFFYNKQNAYMVSTQGFKSLKEEKKYRFVLDTDAYVHDRNIDNRNSCVSELTLSILKNLNDMLLDNYEQNTDQDQLKAYRDGQR